MTIPDVATVVKVRSALSDLFAELGRVATSVTIIWGLIHGGAISVPAPDPPPGVSPPAPAPKPEPVKVEPPEKVADPAPTVVSGSPVSIPSMTPAVNGRRYFTVVGDRNQVDIVEPGTVHASARFGRFELPAAPALIVQDQMADGSWPITYQVGLK